MLTVTVSTLKKKNINKIIYTANQILYSKLIKSTYKIAGTLRIQYVQFHFDIRKSLLIRNKAKAGPEKSPCIEGKLNVGQK